MQEQREEYIITVHLNDSVRWFQQETTRQAILTPLVKRFRRMEGQNLRILDVGRNGFRMWVGTRKRMERVIPILFEKDRPDREESTAPHEETFYGQWLTYVLKLQRSTHVTIPPLDPSDLPQ